MADRTVTANDFDSARLRERIQRVFSTFRWKNPNLLSFYEVTKLIKPEAQAYKGMQAIPVKNIIGSENRYHDFSSAFLPRYNNLKERWESIDAARLDNVTLPPISVYKLGDWYFVRDGNHRVSVARAEGQDYIDAEVVELSTEIPLEEGMTLNELKRRVVAHERERFIEQYNPTYLPMDKIFFTSPGAYPEMVHHIMVHKYYINQNIDRELSFQEGAESWYKNVYSPIVDAMDKEHLKSHFPGATDADIYMWLVRRWDEMKRVDALSTEEDAAKDIAEHDDKSKLGHWIDYMKEKLSRK
ncbi:MAG: transcriptional regulator [Candidatus Ornithospirochaeta sp.]